MNYIIYLSNGYKHKKVYTSKFRTKIQDYIDNCSQKRVFFEKKNKKIKRIPCPVIFSLIVKCDNSTVSETIIKKEEKIYSYYHKRHLYFTDVISLIENDTKDFASFIVKYKNKVIIYQNNEYYILGVLSISDAKRLYNLLVNNSNILSMGNASNHLIEKIISLKIIDRQIIYRKTT